MTRCTQVIIAALFAACVTLFPAVARDYPMIHSLTVTDSLFKQYCSDVEDNYRESAKSGEVFCSFYRYTATHDDTVITLAARCNIPYETLATLNRIPTSKQVLAGTTVLLPTAAGIFVRTANAVTDIERLTVAAITTEHLEPPLELTLRTSGGVTEKLLFYSGRRYSVTERAFFLSTAFRFPLDESVMTSKFGMRKNPVTGNRRFHKGIDLAAPEGTTVHAVRAGKVTKIGTDPVYGNYVIITHDNNWQSFYAHLQTVKKNCLNRHIETGYSIGTVGNTGQSTGPHLHFELRESGSVRNPEDFLLQ